jgi:hypothetical protein
MRHIFPFLWVASNSLKFYMGIVIYVLCRLYYYFLKVLLFYFAEKFNYQIIFLNIGLIFFGFYVWGKPRVFFQTCLN